MFATARHIPDLMKEFENGPLKKYTPCQFKEKSKLIEALAVIHAELVLIHPFREGNGRVARMLSILMALQAGLSPLDFSSIKGKFKEQYFFAVRAALDKNYNPMKKIFESVIHKTIKKDQPT